MFTAVMADGGPWLRACPEMRNAGMAVYLLEVSYTSAAWAEMIHNPQDRALAVRETVERLGGKIGTFWTSLGEFDLVGIISMPDTITAAAFGMAIAAGGSCKAVKTTPLLTMNEGMEAMAKAANCGYEPIRNEAPIE